MVALFRPTLLGRQLTLAAAMLAAALPGALANDVTISSNYGSGSVYGNSVAGNPIAIDYGLLPISHSLTLASNANVGDALGAYASLVGFPAINNRTRLIGGHASGTLFGGYSESGGATDNLVEVFNGDAGSVIGGYAGPSGSEARDNSVIIYGGSISNAVYGGYAIDGAAVGNSVHVYTGHFGTLSENFSGVFGGYSRYGAANSNDVLIDAVAFSNIIGINSEIIISGGATSNSSAINNSVTIRNLSVQNANVTLAGGYCFTSCGDVFTGNTLNLMTSGLIVATLQNFEHLNFYLPDTLAAGGTMLTVTGIADLTGTGGRSSIVDVGINGAASPLAVGQKVTLIHAGSLVTNTDLNRTATGSGLSGVTLSYTFGISVQGSDLIATVQSGGASAPSKALSEGTLAAATLINQGADLAGGKGLANALAATVDEGWTTFGALAGGRERNKTGSHVDVDGLAVMAGLARRFDLGLGDATLGVFADYGAGNYDTFNSFASGVVRGGGDSQTYGGGVAGHLDFPQTATGHAYVEAMARAGVAKNSFSSPDLVSGGVTASYDTRASYASAGAGLGYAWSLDPATTLDVSGRYLWSRLDGDSARLTTGETVDFDAVTSQRTRLGARLSHVISGGWTPFAGAAWEHEFDGEAAASSNGFALDAPSMRGDTGILEAGLALQPAAVLPLSLDVGLQGFVGQREGVAGNLQAKWTF